MKKYGPKHIPHSPNRRYIVIIVVAVCVALALAALGILIYFYFPKGMAIPIYSLLTLNSTRLGRHSITRIRL